MTRLDYHFQFTLNFWNMGFWHFDWSVVYHMKKKAMGSLWTTDFGIIFLDYILIINQDRWPVRFLKITRNLNFQLSVTNMSLPEMSLDLFAVRKKKVSKHIRKILQQIVDDIYHNKVWCKDPYQDNNRLASITSLWKLS